MPRIRRVTEFCLVVVGQGLTAIGGLLGIKILTTYLGPAGYGRFYLGLTIASVMVLVLYGPIGQTVARFYISARENGSAADVLRWTSRKFTRSVLFSFAALVVLAPVAWTLDQLDWYVLIALSVVVGWCFGASTIFAAFLNATRRRGRFVFQQATEATLKPTISLLFVSQFATSWLGALLAFALAFLLPLIAIWVSLRGARIPEISLRSRHSTARDAELHDNMSQYLVPLLWLGAVALFGLHGDKAILQFTAGSAAVGVYAAMYQIANSPVAHMIAALNSFSIPFLFGHDGRSSARGATLESSVGAYRWLVLLTVLMLIAACACFYIWGEWLLEILSTPEFAVHHQSLWLLGIGLACFHLAQQLHFRGFIARNPRVYVVPKLVHSVAFLLLALPLGYSSGVPGICIAFVLASLTYLVIVIFRNLQFAQLGESP